MASLSKYHAVFLLFGAGMFAITTPGQRRWLTHPGPYLAMVIAAAIFSPVLVWNSRHEWISFLWQGSRGLDNHGIRLDWLARSIGGQALWLLPWIWVPLLWELPKCFRRGPSSTATWFIAWMAVAPIVLFTIVAAYASIGFHFHWQAPGYLLLFLPLGATLYQKLEAGDRYSRYWLRGTLAFTTIALLFVTTHSASGWWRAVGPQWLSEKFGEPDDPTLECLDYAPLADALAERGLLGKKDLFLFTNRWFQSGKVDYALGGTMPVFCLNYLDPRSFAFWDQTENWLHKDGVVVSTKKFLTDPVAEYSQYFEKIVPLGTVSVTRGGYVEETLYLHLCQNLKKPFPEPY
ncbi:MAG: glycosyltransferase family 39 protein [Planctomycetota bacterium]